MILLLDSIWWRRRWWRSSTGRHTRTGCPPTCTIARWLPAGTGLHSSRGYRRFLFKSNGNLSHTFNQPLHLSRSHTSMEFQRRLCLNARLLNRHSHIKLQSFRKVVKERQTNERKQSNNFVFFSSFFHKKLFARNAKSLKTKGNSNRQREEWGEEEEEEAKTKANFQLNIFGAFTKRREMCCCCGLNEFSFCTSSSLLIYFLLFYFE